MALQTTAGHGSQNIYEFRPVTPLLVNFEKFIILEDKKAYFTVRQYTSTQRNAVHKIFERNKKYRRNNKTVKLRRPLSQFV